MFRFVSNLGILGVIAMAANGCGTGSSGETATMDTSHELVFKVKGLT
jgi:hypothetical protein